MFIVVIFFLIYGVEVYFKVRKTHFADSKAGVICCCLRFQIPPDQPRPPLVFCFNCLHRLFTISIYPQVRGGFLNDGEFSIPLGIMSFKTVSNNASSSSSNNAGPSSATTDHEEKEGEEDKEEVTVRLMKEEAGLPFLPFALPLFCLLISFLLLSQLVGLIFFVISLDNEFFHLFILLNNRFNNYNRFWVCGNR